MTAQHEDGLLVKSEQDTLQSVSKAVVYLETVVGAMRRLGVVEFDGIKLGPPPSDGAESDDDSAVDAAKAERLAREERRRVALASSGGPLRRVEQL